MMMKMRENMHVVLYLLVIAFVFTIFLSWGAGGAEVLSNKGLAGKIGGQNISLQDFDSRVRLALDNYKNQTGKDYPDAQMDTFRKQVWEQMVAEYVLKEEMNDRQIEPTADEVRYSTLKNPLPQLKSNPNFQENGAYSEAKLATFLGQNTQAAFQLKYLFEQSYPQQVMKFFVEQTHQISDAEARETFKKENLKANLRYFGILKSKLPTSDFVASDAEIESYYNEHKDQYEVEEKRQIQYIRIDVLPSSEDTLLVATELEDIKSRIITDELDFADEAIAESEDVQSRDNNGESEWFAKGSHSLEFDNLAFATEKNQIFGPVYDNGKYILGRVIDRHSNKKAKTDSLKIQQIVKYVVANTTTIDNFDDLAAQSIEAAKMDSLESFAKKNSIYFNETAFFADNGNVPGIGKNAYLNHFIFSKSDGDVSREVRLNKGKTIYVARIKAIKDAGYQELSEVKGRIKNIVLNDKKGEKAAELARKAKEKLTSATFKEVLKMDDFKKFAQSDSTGTVAYYDRYIRNIGKSPKVVRFIENAKISDISDVISTNTGAFIIEVLRKTEFSESEFEAKKKEIRRRLTTNLTYTEFRNWLEEAKKKHDIEVYRLY